MKIEKDREHTPQKVVSFSERVAGRVYRSATVPFPSARLVLATNEGVVSLEEGAVLNADQETWNALVEVDATLTAKVKVA